MSAHTASQSPGETLSIHGHRIRITHPDKVLYPATGTTKADVIAYLQAVAPRLIPLAGGRPATRKRWIEGVGTTDDPGESFFHRALEGDAPRWIHRRTIAHLTHPVTYPLIDDVATLVWFAQRDTLEFHVPQWRFQGLRRSLPDRIVFDLDPGEEIGLAECAEVALLIRERLERQGLRPWPVTSGSRGVHVYADLDGTRTSEETVAFAHSIADDLAADSPSRIVSNMNRERRVHRVLIDWSQNHATKTTVVPYSLRGRLHPTVAWPRKWQEIERPGQLTQLDYRDALSRLDDA